MAFGAAWPNPQIEASTMVLPTSSNNSLSATCSFSNASILYFKDFLCPDFKKNDFYNAIFEYQNRERRFGKTSEQILNQHE